MSKFKRNIKRTLLFAGILGIIFISLHLSLLFFADSLLKSTIQDWCYKESDSVYSVDFNEISIDIIRGNVILTEFKLYPDTLRYFTHNDILNNNLYQLQLDTFLIDDVRFTHLFRKHNILSVRELSLYRPILKVFSRNKKTSSSQDSVSFEDIQRDLINTVFRFTESIEIDFIRIIDGNFDFLTPRIDNSNQFSIDKISILLRNFNVSQKTFATDNRAFFSEKIEIFLSDYQLKLSDNLHKLTAKTVLLDTKQKRIEFEQVRLFPIIEDRNKLSKLSSNVFDISIATMSFENSNLKEIYENNILHLSKAKIRGIDINIYKQKKEKKIIFNKDTLLDRIDVFPLFSGILHKIQIDTISIEKGQFDKFNNIKSTYSQTSVGDFEVKIFDLHIDSESLIDTSRIFHSKNVYMSFNDLKIFLKDSVHVLHAEQIIGQSKSGKLQASNITLKPKNLYLFSITNKNKNDIRIDSLDILGFNYSIFLSKNQIYINKIIIGKSNFSILSYASKRDVKPDGKMMLNFADKIIVNQIDIHSGNLSYKAPLQKINSIKGGFKINLSDLIFDPHKSQMTKSVSVNNVDFLLHKTEVTTQDSMYSFSADSVFYSTKKSIIRLSNAKLEPLEHNIVKKLLQKNKNSTISLSMPLFEISNTNLNTSLASDSLRLSNLTLHSPKILVTNYSYLLQKNNSKSFIDSIKRKNISIIVRTLINLQVEAYNNENATDSLSLKTFAKKKTALDSLAKFAAKKIVDLKIKQKILKEVDTSIQIIVDIRKITVDNMKLIATNKLSINQIDSIREAYNFKIIKLEKYNEKIKFNVKNILANISTFFPLINSDTLTMRNCQLIFNAKTKNDTKEVFRTNLTVQLFNFNYNVNKNNNKKILFSDAFFVKIKNLFFNLKDNLHQIHISNLILNSSDSTVKVNNILLNPKYIDPNKPSIQLSIRQIALYGVDYLKFYAQKQLDISKMAFYNPNLTVNLGLSKDTTNPKRQIESLVLPKHINDVFIKNINVSNGKIKMIKTIDNSDITLVKSDFRMNMYDFFIDSVSNISENLFYLPIKYFNINFNNFIFYTADTTKKICAENILIDSYKNKIIVTEPTLQTTLDTGSIFEQGSKKPIVNFKTKQIKLSGIDYDKLRFAKSLILYSLDIDSSDIVIFLPPPNKAKKFSIDSIDLYKKTKKFFEQIVAQKITIKDVKLNRTICDSNREVKKFADVGVEASKLRIDSSATATYPNLFYCDDIKITHKNFTNLSKNKIYKNEIGKLVYATKDKTLSIYNFSYKPVIPIWSVQDSYEYKKVIFDVFAKQVYLKDIDIFALLDKKISIKQINGDSVIFKIYADKNYPQSPWPKKHLISFVLNLGVPIDISLVSLSNFNMYYEEINPKNQQKASMSLRRADLKIIKLLNDTARINKSDIHTIVKAHGFINDIAELNLNIFFDLKSKGKNAKIMGEIGSCKANVFNSYTVNGANIDLNKGVFHKIEFNFSMKDTIALGKMRMEYNGLKAYLISNDTTKRTKLKFVSWLINTILVKSNNPKYGIYPKIGKIAHIRDKKFGDIRMWVMAILSGMQSTIVFNSQDAKKIKRIMKENKKKFKNSD